MVTAVSVAMGRHAYCVLQWINTQRSSGTTPIIAAVGVECPGSSNYHPCIIGGRGISSCATNGIQMVMVDSVVVVLLASFVLWPTSGPLTTEMIPTTEEVDAA